VVLDKGKNMCSQKIPTILLVDTDESLLTVLSYNFERYGFVVNTAKDATGAVQIAERVRPDLIVLAQELAGNVSGLEVCSVLRSKAITKGISVILTFSSSSDVENIIASHSNIVDYLRRPFSPSELIKRVRSIFSKEQPKANQTTSQLLEYKNLKMNVGSYRVTRNGQAIHLGPTEFKILQCLMQLPSRVLSREDIMSHVWGYNSQIEPRTIDVHINRLRSALKNDNLMGTTETPSIKTVRSAGYCLN
jgi:two-component system phosphate regulon response regulator PhoB